MRGQLQSDVCGADLTIAARALNDCRCGQSKVYGEADGADVSDTARSLVGGMC